jgi:hypothetical protein
MLPLSKVSHEHHDVLWRHVSQLNDLADRLNCDCLDSGWLEDRLTPAQEQALARALDHLTAAGV